MTWRMGEWANGRTGERANGRTGERANGRMGEWANGRLGVMGLTGVMAWRRKAIKKTANGLFTHSLTRRFAHPPIRPSAHSPYFEINHRNDSPPETELHDALVATVLSCDLYASISAPISRY